MKDSVIAGDTLDFNTAVAAYPASEGWTLTYRLVPRVSGTAYTFAATRDGDEYRSQVGASTTAAWTAGEYSWTAYVSLSGERHSVDSGTLTILPDPAVVAAYDARTHARTALDAIEAVMENRATVDQQEYTIGSRSLKRMTADEIIKWRDYYRGQVGAEEMAERVRSGQGGNRLVVKF